MKARYKIGTLIEFSVAGGTNHGVINAITFHKEGIRYGVEAYEGEAITEAKVINAYRPVKVVARKATAKTKAVSSKKATTTKTDNQEKASLLS